MKSGFSFHLKSLSVLALVLGVVYIDIFKTGMIFGSDVTLEFLLNRAYGFGEVQKCNIPLWNPYQFCGYPFVASFQSAIFYPLNAVFLILNTATALVISSLLHLYLAGCFGYGFAYSLTKSRLSSLSAGIIIMLNAYILSRVYAGHITIYSTYPWLFLCFWSYHKAIVDRNWKYAFLTGLGISMEILAGFPLTVYNTCFGLLIYGLVYPSNDSVIRKTARSLGILFTAGITGGLFSWIQLYPSMVLTKYSGRAGGVDYEFAMSNSYPPENFITFLAPSFFGNMVDSRYWGRWYLWEFLTYFSIPVLIIFLTSVCIKNRAVRTWLFVAIACVIMILGKYAFYYQWLYEYIPGVNMFRGPGRMAIVLVPAFAIMTALFLAHLQQKKDTAHKVLGIAFKWSVGLAVLIFAILMICNAEGEDSIFWRTLVTNVLNLGDRHGSIDNWRSAAFYASSFKTSIESLWHAFTLLSLSAGLFYWGRKSGVNRNWLIVFIVLITIDLCWVGKRYLQAVQPIEEKFPAAMVKVMNTPEQIPQPRIATATDTIDVAKGSLDDISHIGGYDAAMLKRYIEYINAHSGRPLDSLLVISETAKPGKMLKMTGLTHVVSTPKKPAYPGSDLVYSDNQYKLYQIRNPYPRAFIVHKYRNIPERELRFEIIKSKGFDPLREVILEKEPNIKPVESPKSSKLEMVEFIDYQAHEVKLKVQLASPGILVFTDAFYPNWKATVNGKIQTILAANHLFRAIALPAGKHEIAFSYQTQTFHASLKISLAAMIICILLCYAPVVFRRQEK